MIGSGGEVFEGHPGDGLGGAQPNLLKEIGIATGLGIVGGLYWLSVMSEDKHNVTTFWKNYKPREE